jgi:hypothetical protein
MEIENQECNIHRHNLQRQGAEGEDDEQVPAMM